MDQNNVQEDIFHIRDMMEKSSRVFSLSGLSGVFAGVTAFAGIISGYLILQKNRLIYRDLADFSNVNVVAVVPQLLIITLVTLMIALFFGYFFTVRKSKKKGLKIWDLPTKRLVMHFAIPVITGGFFCFALWFHHLYLFILPATLVFYGLALVNVSKFTWPVVQNLGFIEIILGVLSLFFLPFGMVFWGIGFGVLHIVYGILMHKKYD